MIQSFPEYSRAHSERLLRHAEAALRFARTFNISTPCLQVISDRQEYPQAADARGMMRALDNRTYIPS